jgi:3,8-divinyl chlorophyllide a/chlorophyllide a reductase subunit X
LFEDDFGLESLLVNTTSTTGTTTLSKGTPVTIMMKDLRAEAAVEPAPVSTSGVTKETQIIAIYGKGGIGKSFTLANLSYMMAQQGKKVLPHHHRDLIEEKTRW